MRFTFPGTASSGQPYEIVVRTQPHNPDQVCSVQHGAGTVASADVSDIAVHCVTPAAPPGLDTTFGGTGRVSTPVGGGQGEAVVIQPGGGIVTAGWRTVGAGTDFALTRHDASGNLDQSFGTNGIATTDLGGPGDQAYDAALLPDGGIVAVGETDAAGIQKQQFALARYTADGALNPSFGTGGTVTTNFTGHGDVANAVAVQGDGKIVVAGFAFSSGINGDFALARYNADGSLDTSFGTGGKVTTTSARTPTALVPSRFSPTVRSSSSARPGRTSPSLGTRRTASSTGRSAPAGRRSPISASRTSQTAWR